MNEPKDFEHLCDSILNGDASELEIATFQERLHRDEVARKAYASQARLHALLTFQNGIASEADKEGEKVSATITPKNRNWVPLSALAAAIAILLGFLSWQFIDKSPSGVSFEIVAAAENNFSVGEMASAETLKLDKGSLSFRLESGALVEAKAPFEIALKSAMHLRVLSGAITVDVGENAKGFIVDTENARVVDLGTRFGVLAGQSETDVVVFEGEVDVFKPDSSESKIVNLREGEGVRVDSYWVARRLEAVEIQGESLAIMGGDGSKKPIITRVSDDINDVGFHRFYSIHPKAMRDGMLAYSTHGMPRWTAMPDQVFPGRLRGADTVRTFSPDSKDTDLHLTLDLAEPCDVFVILDTRSQAPHWLQEKFVKTAHQIRSGPWKTGSRVARDISPDEKGELYVDYTIWRHRVKSPGSLTLGPPRQTDEAAR